LSEGKGLAQHATGANAKCWPRRGARNRVRGPVRVAAQVSPSQRPSVRYGLHHDGNLAEGLRQVPVIVRGVRRPRAGERRGKRATGRR
jgi:hypothetical protein